MKLVISLLASGFVCNRPSSWILDGSRMSAGLQGKQQLLAFETEDVAGSSDRSGGGMAKCQYSGIKSQRPAWGDLVSVCLAGPDSKLTSKCVKKSKKTYGSGFRSGGRVITVLMDEVTMGQCEELCTSGDCTGKSCKPIPEVGQCRGYVVRAKYDSEAGATPSCWLIPEDAKNASNSYDLRLDKSAMVEKIGHKTAKNTFIKESCNCGTRYVHVHRLPQQTKLAFWQATVKDLRGLEQKATEKGKFSDKNAESSKAMYEGLKPVLMAKPVLMFEGLYDYLPAHIPHRIYRGNLRILPNWMVAKFGKRFAPRGATALNGQKGYSDYWQSPVQISNVYKKMDFSAFIYQCYDKETKHEGWYLASRAYLLKLLAKTLDTDEGTLTEQLSEDLSLQMMFFFNLKCMGYRLGAEGEVFPPLQDGQDPKEPVPADVRIDIESLSNGRGVWSAANHHGCFENEKSAAEVREVNIIKEILEGETPHDSDNPFQNRRKRESSPKLLSNNICEQLLTGESKSVLSKLDVAKKIAKWQKTLGKAVAVSATVKKSWSAVKKAVKRGGWWGGKRSEEKEAPREESPADRMEVDNAQILGRAQQLIDVMKQVMMRISAIGETEDEQLKIFCAKEMLETVQNAGGLWPKIAQNLAMRPDVVKDDFARNKLKETQSGSKNLGEKKTLQYITELRPEIELPELGKVFILDFMKYERFLSAGSVGQVDVYSLKEDTEAAKVFKEHVVPSDWAGRTDKFIVKTVFKTTEELYTTDWKLLEFIFVQLGGYLPQSFKIIWATLTNMETSIFDEFDLTKEAKFTARGRGMLKQFTDEYGIGVRATTPLGLATTSKYVMIQTFAQGLPLSSYMELIKGQKDRLAVWRTKIYATILNVFGYTSIRHGFFQSDPHPGNWFWDGPTQTLSLIDWGGVENWADENVEPALKQGHCNLARLYAGMGHLSQTWSKCDAVVIQSDQLPAIAGTYLRTGVSIYAVHKGEPALLMGHGYSLSYTKDDGLTLWFDGTHWHFSEVHPEAEDIYKKLATITDKSLDDVAAPNAVDQSFFGKVFGKVVEAMQPGEGKNLELEQLIHVSIVSSKIGNALPKPKKHTIHVSSARSDVCTRVPDRTQAYELGAAALGIKYKTLCQDFRFINTDTAALRDYLRTDRTALVCLRKDEKGVLVGEVGVPSRAYPIHKENVLTIEIEDVTVDAPMMTGHEAFGLAARDLPQRVREDQSLPLTPETALTIAGIGRYIGPRVDNPVEGE